MSAPIVQPYENPHTVASLRLVSHLRKHWFLAFCIAACVTTGATFRALGQTKLYLSSTSLMIDPTPPKPLGQAVQGVVDMGTGMYWNNQEYYETQYRILQSSAIALKTVQRLALHRDMSFIANKPPGTELPPGPASINQKDAAGILQARLVVSPVKDSRIVTVTFEDADPERARRILATHVSIYVEHNVDRVLDSTKDAAEWLDVQLDKLKDELSDSELALHQYKADQNILSVSVDDQSNMLREEMRIVNAKLTRIRMNIKGLQARFDQLTTVSPDDPTHLPSQELLESAVLTAFRSQYVVAKQAVVGLTSAGKGGQHPEVKAARAQEATLRAALSEEITNIKEAVEHSLQATKQEANGLAGLLARAKVRALELNRLGLDYRRLERSKVNTERLYSLVLERSKESSLTQIMRFNNISVVDPANTPTRPSKPRIPLHIATGILGGLLLGLAGALIRGSMDRTIKGPEETEQILGLSFLGLLPKAGHTGNTYGKWRKRHRKSPDTAPALSAHLEPQGTIAEASRAIRTNLMFIAPDRPQRRLLVTSGGPSEGKTTMACSIAIAMAQADLKVLLLDCDLRKPRLHRVFGRLNDSGVSTALLEPKKLNIESLKTDIPNLSLLPAGPQAPNPAELLQSARFGSLLTELSAEFDRIVIDSPPVVAVADAAILSTQVDGTVFVVRGMTTRRDLAERAVRTLRDVNANLLGCVLNGMSMDAGKRSAYYYYSYYGRRDEAEASSQGEA